MSSAGLLARLVDAGVRLSANGDKLHIEAPAGILTPELRQELADHKADLLAAMHSPLLEAATNIASVIHFTIRETEDVAGDVEFLRRVRLVLEEWPARITS